MKSDVIADTSAWVQFFNRPHSEGKRIIDELLSKGSLYMVDIVLSEILQGTRTEREFRLLKEHLCDLPFLETDVSSWSLAGKISFDLRRKGIIIPITDCLIAALSLENDCQILTLDPHFSQIPQITLYK